MSDKALQPVEQKVVLFYDDELTAVRADGDVYVSIPQMCGSLGLDTQAQRRRMERHEIMADGIGVANLATPGGQQDTYVLRVDLIPLWLSGVRVSAVRDEIQPKLVRFQREAAKVLWQAFQDGRLTTAPDMDIESLLQQDSPAAQAYQMAMAVVRMARQQLLMEAKLDKHGAQLGEHAERLDQLEAAVGGEHVTEAQAAQISQAVKAVALAIGTKTKRNEFGAVYGELYRRFNVASYKAIPQRRFEAVMDFLNEWLQSHIGNEPF
jgi:hypothetical protein